jgi:hypothetical protein
MEPVPSAPTEEHVIVLEIDSVEKPKPKEVDESQDNQQKITVTLSFLIEFYRALVASLLILFVPQRCGDHVCSMHENAQTGNDPLYNAGFAFNFITLAAFSVLYGLELKRESKLIAYLEVNPREKTDNDSVGQTLTKLPERCKNSILLYDNLYCKSAYVALAIFIINIVLSGIVINKYYLDDKTASTFLTSVLFMVSKIGDVYATVNVDRNIFYSAYMKGKIQYNDVDPGKIQG